nr:hypothetical protein [Tanacetum cinerariifolium]
MEDHTIDWLRVVLISRVFARDIYEDYDVSCAGIVGVKHRHKNVRDTLVDKFVWSVISSGKEVNIVLGRGLDKPLRPTNMLLYSWVEGLDYEAKCADIEYGFLTFSFSSFEELEKWHTVQNINHSAFRSMFKREKLSGNNFNDWFCQLKLVLRVEKKIYVVEQPLPVAPAADSAANVLAERNAVYDAYNEVACFIFGSMTPKLHGQFENSLPYDMIKELKYMFEKQAGVERFDLIQIFHTCKQEEGKPVVAYVLQMKGYVDQLERLGYMLPQDLVSLPKKAETPKVMMIKDGKIQKSNKKSLKAKGKGKANGNENDKQVYILRTKNPKPSAKEHPTKDDTCHHCKEVRKLKQGALYLYVGNGVRVQVEAIGSFNLVLPNGLVICLDNCHYAPSITRGVVSVHCLVEYGFVQCFTDFGISVSKNNIFYFNAIPSNGIYEIDMHDLVPNDNSIYNVSTKRAKHNLDSTYLRHCRLAHISKKRIEKLQQEGLLKSIDDESFDQCVSCLSSKMTRKSFPHRLERVTDLLGIIHTDACGPLRHVSRQDIVRSIMNLTTLSLSFWDYAQVFATRILNMILTKKVDKTSYELWNRKVPNLSYLKVWGCEALVNSDTRPPMLDMTDFASWKLRIRLYCRGKQNGVYILQLIDEGPFQMGTFMETLSEGTEVVYLLKQHEGRQNRGQGNNARGASAASYGGAQNRVGQDNVVDDDVDEQPIQDLALNVDNVFQADDYPVYDEAGPSYDLDILSEVHDHDHYQVAACKHHKEHEMHDDVQPNYVVDSHADYTRDSEMIPYDQYAKDNAVLVVQTNVSSIPTDAYMMILNDMHEQPAQYVSGTTQNTVVEKSLIVELAIYKQQVELNNREAHLDYLKHLKESVETLREIVKEAKVERPLERSLASACLYAKHSQELLEYVIGTCPKDFNQRDKKPVATSFPRKKQVTFVDPCDTSTNNTLTHVKKQIMHQTNDPAIPSTRVNCATVVSGSKPMSNTKKDMTLPAKSDMQKVKVYPRKNKSSVKHKNHADSSISYKHTDAACEHHEVHEMHDDIQPNYVVDSHADYTSDSNMISYDQYVKDNAVLVIQ